MARPPREDVEGAVHHVWARGVDKRTIFVDDVDRRSYLDMLGRAVRWAAWRCLAYCLMNNHVHLIIEAPRGNLGRGIQLLHGRYAQRFNQRHDRTGHLFESRYGANRVTSDEQLWTTVSYVALNPVAAGLCARPEEWPWSSHAATLELSPPEWLDVPSLLMYFAALAGNPLRRYSELVGG